MNTTHHSKPLASNHVEPAMAENVQAIKDWVDLLAEREITPVLLLLRGMAAHFQAQTSVTPDQIRDFVEKSDLQQRADKGEEVSEDDRPSKTKSARPTKPAKRGEPPGRRAWRRTHSTG
jgi:hypothetical protein